MKHQQQLNGNYSFFSSISCCCCFYLLYKKCRVFVQKYTHCHNAFIKMVCPSPNKTKKNAMPRTKYLYMCMEERCWELERQLSPKEQCFLLYEIFLSFVCFILCLVCVRAFACILFLFRACYSNTHIIMYSWTEELIMPRMRKQNINKRKI